MVSFVHVLFFFFVFFSWGLESLLRGEHMGDGWKSSINFTAYFTGMEMDCHCSNKNAYILYRNVMLLLFLLLEHVL